MSKHAVQFTHNKVVSNPTPSVPRSIEDVNTGNKTTCDAGFLVPVYWQETLPGTGIDYRLGFFGRLATPKFPIMDNLVLTWHAFHVPMRLLWDKWERFQGFKPTVDASTDFVIPSLTGNAGGPYTPDEYDPLAEVPLGVADYLGFPIKEAITPSNGEYLTALLHRAYRMIWNKWYRDQSYQDELTVSIGDGPDDFETSDVLQFRNRRQDYIFSCLPEPQRGPAIPIPVNNDGLASVFGTGDALGLNDGTNDFGFARTNALGAVGSYETRAVSGLYGDPVGTSSGDASISVPNANFALGVTEDPDFSGLVADVGAIIGTINQLRTNAVFQQIFELDNRGGTRYPEAVWNRFRVVLPDFRVNYPEYLGGGSQPLMMNTVPQTSPTAGTNAQGSLAAYSTLTQTGHLKYTAVEHGYIMILCSISAPLTYQQRVDRALTRRTRFDFYEPLTAHLGDQAVYQRELYFPPVAWDRVLGYGPRWEEYRSHLPIVTGRFRSNSTATLDPWHLALAFESAPDLDGATLIDSPPVDRVIAVPTEPQFKLDFGIMGKEILPMPRYSIPGLQRF